jgi:hypothetical protein
MSHVYEDNELSDWSITFKSPSAALCEWQEAIQRYNLYDPIWGTEITNRMENVILEEIRDVNQ